MRECLLLVPGAQVKIVRPDTGHGRLCRREARVWATNGGTQSEWPRKALGVHVGCGELGWCLSYGRRCCVVATIVGRRAARRGVWGRIAAGRRMRRWRMATHVR